MKIRKATPDDLDALVQLRLDFLCEEHGEFPPESRDAFRRQWANTAGLSCALPIQWQIRTLPMRS